MSEVQYFMEKKRDSLKKVYNIEISRFGIIDNDIVNRPSMCICHRTTFTMNKPYSVESAI